MNLRLSYIINVTASLLCVLVLPLTARAQTPADAGQLLQQIEKERGTALPREGMPKVTPAPEPMKVEQGVTLTVTAFRFAGNTLLGDDQLMPAVAEFLNRPLGFSELEKAAAAVADAYRKAGWIVRAYLPQQDIQNGIVTIQIVEAVFGGALLEGNPPERIKAERVLGLIEAAQAKGDPLQAEMLDRALLLADDLPGVSVFGSLRAGTNARETDLILKMSDEPLFAGEVSADNTGARSTGRQRFSAGAYLSSPLKLGDQTSMNLMHTRGSDYGRLAYTIPVGTNGWRVGASTSRLRYKLVGSDFSALEGKGTSMTTGLDANFPLIRSRLKNLYLGLNYDKKRFDNEANQATTTRYHNTTLTFGLSGNAFDNIGGGGANSASIALVAGRLTMGALDAAENAALEGDFRKLRYSVSRQQVITADLSFYAALSGQDADGKTLDSSEKFYLGGSGGVRAYPASEGGGSSGNLVNLELRWRLPEGVVLTGFYDHGKVRNYDESLSYGLKGSGLALGWQAKFGLSLKVVLARRFGENPNPAANGNDQDGSLTKSRVWLTVSQPF